MQDLSNDSGAIDQDSGAVPEKKQDIDFRKDMLRYKDQLQAEAAKRKQLEDELQEIKLIDEQKKGNYSKVIEELREKNKKLESDIKGKDYVYAKSNIDLAVKSMAIANGCQDAEAFLRLVGDAKLESIAFDSNYRPDIDDVKSIVEEGMKQYEHIGLFGRKVNLVDGVPSKNTIMPDRKVDIKNMSWDEAKRYAKTLNN